MDLETTTPVDAPEMIDNNAALTEGEATDADLVAAVREAGGSESVAAEAAAATPPPAPAEAAPAPTDEPKIAAVLRAREKAFAERQDAEDFAARRRQQAEQEAAQILADARARAAADYEADLAARRARFHETPTNAIRELGFQTQDMVDAVAREGTPEWKAMRELDARTRAAEAALKAAGQTKAEFELFKASLLEERRANEVRAVEHQFLTEHAAPEKTPYLHKRYEPDEIVAKAHALAHQWRTAGVAFAHSDVAEYLEHQARMRLAGGPPAPQVGAASGASKVKANGSRTLSAGHASERRAAPKPLDEMSPEEERQALIEAVAEARRINGS